MTLALLVLGTPGPVGAALVPRAHRAPDVPFARAVPALDLTDPFDVRDVVQEWARVVRSERPAARLVVVSTGTGPVGQLLDEEAAFALNAAAPAVLAAACARLDARLLQLSTVEVFPGDGVQPYDVADPAAPRSRFGRTALAGEQAVREILPAGSWVVRIAQAYGADGPGLVGQLARRAVPEAGVTGPDTLISPTWTRDLADGLLGLCRSQVPGGVLHAAAEACTLDELAGAVAGECGLAPGAPDGRSEPVGCWALSSRSWRDAGLPALPGWRTALAEAFRTEGPALRSAT